MTIAQPAQSPAQVPDATSPTDSPSAPVVKSESVPPPSPPPLQPSTSAPHTASVPPSASNSPQPPAAAGPGPGAAPPPSAGGGAAADPAQPTCSNCKTQTTPLWRRSDDGILCNACALYQKMKGCPRPVALKTDTIKHRNRSKGTKKEKSASATGAGASPKVKSANQQQQQQQQPKANGSSNSNARSSSMARKSKPGGADMDDRDDSFDEDYFVINPSSRERSMSKRRKRDTPDSEDRSPPPQAQGPPPPPQPETMYPPQAVLGEAALRHYAAQLHARSASADARGSAMPSAASAARYGLQSRSPSQPAFPYNAALGYRPMMYPPSSSSSSASGSYDAMNAAHYMAAHQGMPPYAIRPEHMPHPHHHQQQPNWTEAMQQPARGSTSHSRQNGGTGDSSGTQHNTSSNTISLPPIRSLTEEIDNEARGRQRERMALPAMAAAPLMAAAGVAADPSAPSRNVSQTSSRASTVTGIPYSLGLSHGDVSLHDSSFPQSDSRRPHDTLSDSSSGSNSAGSPRSSFQSPYIAPTSSSSVVPSPGFGPLPDSAVAGPHSGLSNGPSFSERRGRSVTRKVDSDMGNRIEALRMHDDIIRSGSVSRSSSPRASSSRPRHVPHPGHPETASNDMALWRSSVSRSRTSSPHPAASDDEMNKLRMRVNELELINSLLVSRLTELEHPRRPSASGGATDRSSSVSRSSYSNLPSLPISREDSQGELRAAAAMDQS